MLRIARVNVRRNTDNPLAVPEAEEEEPRADCRRLRAVQRLERGHIVYPGPCTPTKGAYRPDLNRPHAENFDILVDEMAVSRP